MLDAKRSFKSSLQAIAPDGKRVQFVEKYGELKIAVANIAAPKATAQSLAHFLATQGGNGHAV